MVPVLFANEVQFECVQIIGSSDNYSSTYDRQLKYLFTICSLYVHCIFTIYSTTALQQQRLYKLKMYAFDIIL